MSIKLIPPDPKRNPYYRGRGTHRGVYVDRSTKHTDKQKARGVITTWERAIERGEYASSPSAEPSDKEVKRAPTFAEATLAYLRAGGDGQYLGAVIELEGEFALRDKLVKEIDQIMIDNCANAIMPDAPAATKNRNFYTPVSAVLKRAGNTMEIKRPVGWRGKKSQSWLEPEQARPLIENCYRLDAEFGLLCMTYLYTGERLSEPLKSHVRDLKLDTCDRHGNPAPILYIPDTKNGEPRPVHLPPVLVEAFRAMPPRPKSVGHRPQDDAGKPWLKRDPAARLFRFHPGGHLRDMLAEAMKQTGISFPAREGGFHIFCHTYGTWMTRYGGLDTEGLVRTKRWKNAESASRYAHTVASYEARQADLLPRVKLPRGLRR